MRYRIEAPRASGYTVTRQQIVHGVAIGTAETLASTTWVQSLLADLDRSAQAQGLSVDALENLMYR